MPIGGAGWFWLWVSQAPSRIKLAAEARTNRVRRMRGLYHIFRILFFPDTLKYMRFLLLLVLVIAASAWAQTPPAWVEKSNQNSQLLIALMARYSPEDAAAQGVKGLDEQISAFSPDLPQRFRRDLAVARIEMQKRLALEKDPLVRKDLEILMAEVDRNIRSSEAHERHLLPYQDVAGAIFFGVKSLLDDQITADRHPAALVRLRKYT